MKIFNSQDQESRARIEIIPMIDIMFFLLVVFIFISLSLMKLNAVSLILPKASDRPMAVKDKTMDISIGKDGRIFFEGKPVSRPELAKALGGLPKGPEVHYVVIVSGDREARLQRLVDVLDLVDQEGFSNLAIQTDRP